MVVLTLKSGIMFEFKQLVDKKLNNLLKVHYTNIGSEVHYSQCYCKLGQEVNTGR